MHPLRLLPGLVLLAVTAVFLAPAPAAAAGAPADAVQVDDPAVMGQWGEVMPWPDKAVHSILLHTGKVLWFRGESTNMTFTWDPITNEISSQPFFDNIFCSGHSVLPDGRVMVTSGRIGNSGSLGPKYTFIFDPMTETWTRGPDMRLGRYYATNVLIGDGRTLVFSGYDDTHTVNEMVESFVPGTGPGGTDQWELLEGANRFMAYYPRMHLLSDGTVVHVGKATGGARLDPVANTWTPIDGSNYGSRSEGTSVLLPPGYDRVMIMGGGSSTNTCEIIDFNEPNPTWRYTTPMAYGRIHLNNVILPDGTVLVSGGKSSDSGETVDPNSAVYAAEIFDPITERWRTVASMHTFRQYHSSAVLLPDGRCLWAGTDDNHTAEIYSPPYLFKGPRPTITSAPVLVQYGEPFDVQTPNAASIRSVCLIRPGSTTHSQNMDQRYVPLAFGAGAGVLHLEAPTNPNIAPPGFYLMFILDGNGVPSVAKFIKLGGDPPPTIPNRTPFVDAGPDRSLRLPSLLHLSATVIDDGVHHPTPTITWSQAAGPGTVTFSDPGSATTTASFSEAGTYLLRLSAFDGERTGNDVVTVTVRAPCGADEFLESRVAAGADDAEEAASGSVVVTGTDLDLVLDASLQTVGLRFTGIDIPQGAVIANAWLQFTSDAPSADATSLRIHGQDADSASAFTTATRNVSSRPRTDAFVTWSVPSWTAANLAGAEQRTPDLSGVIQEIVDRPGWAGRSLALLVTGSGQRLAKSFERQSSAAPLLRIDYVCGSTNRPPVVDAGPDLAPTYDPATTPRPSVSLAGRVTDDGQPAPPRLTSTWRQLSGPPGVTFGDSLAAATTATFPGAGDYELSLTGFDGRFRRTDVVAVRVRLTCGGSGRIARPVIAGADDAEESASGSVSLSGGNDLELVLDGSLQTVGIRFTDLEIARGAVITGAWVQFTSHEIRSEATQLKIQAVAADSAAIFTTTTRSLSSRPRTAASVDWAPAPWTAVGVAGAEQRTPDLTAVIQEVVDRPGWQGKSLALIVTGTGRRTAKAYEALASGAAVLHIEYGCAGTNRRPTADAGPDQALVFDPANPARPRVTLAGRVDDDGLPVPPGRLVGTWRQVGGPPGVAFGDSLAPGTTATFPGAGSYLLRLTASDGALTAADEMAVTVRSCVGQVDRRIAAGADDAEESASGSVSLSGGSDLELVLDSSLQTVGLRFTGVDILPGAVITRAWVQFTSHAANSEATALEIRGEDADTAAVLVASSRNLSSRPRTDAFASWSPAPWTAANLAGDEQRTSDLSAVIQEIVDRPGWQGRSLCLLITGTGRRNAKAYEALATGAPLLHVEYGCGNRKPVVDAGPDQNVLYDPGQTLSVALAGRVTDDGLPAPPGRTVAAWRQVAGPAGVTFADATAPATTAFFPEGGSYELSLTADDGAASVTDRVLVRLSDRTRIPTVIDRAIAAGGDDAEETASGSVTLSSSDLDLLVDGSSQHRAVGLRFTALAIPPGATISNAWLQLKAKEAQSDPTALVVRAQAVDNAPAFAATSGNLTTRALTAAQAGWSAVPAWTANQATAAQRTPELKDVIQEIVSRPGWASGNALALVITGSGRRVAYPFESGAANAAVLHVEYLTGPPPPPPPIVNQPPSVDAGPDTTVMLNGAAHLRGRVADDGRPSPLTVRWSRVSGPGAVTFDAPTQAASRATFGAAGAYRLELMASDGELERRDTVAVTVLDPANVPTVLDRAVAAGADDVEESASGSVSLSSSDLEMMIDGSSPQRAVGVRFVNLPIPPGAVVTTAWVQFKAKEAHADPTTLTVRGQAHDSAPAFASASGNVTGRATTGAAATWASPPAWTVGQATAAQRTPELRDVIQEIVSRPGWASGNALALVITGSGRRVASSFEHGAANAPVLHVEFTTGTPPPPPPDVNQPPVVDAGPDTTVRIDGAAHLRGRVADDGRSSPLTVMWRRASGPGAVTFDAPTQAASRATFGAAGAYRLELMAADGEFERRDTVTVTVVDPSRLPTVLDRAVAAGADDVEEGPSGSVSLSSSDLEMMVDGSSVQRAVGIRFVNLPIPPGVTVTTAWVQFKAKEAHADPTTLTVRGQAHDSAPAFASASGNVTGRATTAAAATWASPPAWTVGQATAAQRSPELRDVIQEIVSRPGWASGNALALVITGSGRRVASAYEHGAANAPVLHVEFTTAPPEPPPSTSSNEPPVVHAGPDTTVRIDGAAYLRGRATDDGRPGPLTIHWMVVSAPGSVTFDDMMRPVTRARFGATGVYRLALMAMDGELETTDTLVVTVVPATAANRPPVAALEVTPRTGAAPLAVVADASASTDADGDSLRYYFDFGDAPMSASLSCGLGDDCCCAPGPCGCGHEAMEAMGAGSGPVVSHEYAAGEWTVMVIVTDGRGGADTAFAAVSALPNLVRNPSFEASLSGWNANGTRASVARVAGGHHGDWCIEARGDSLPANTFGVNDAPNWVSPTAGPGSRYRFSAWVRSERDAGKAQIRVREYLNGVLQGTQYVSPLTTLTPSWQLLTLEVSATVSGGTLDFQVMNKPVVGREAFQVDDVAVVLLPAAAAAVEPGSAASLAGEPGEGAAAAVDLHAPVVPRITRIAAVFPNPSAGVATVRFELARAARVSLEVYDLRGARVRRIAGGRREAGVHGETWDGRDDGGRRMPKGMYVVRFQADRHRETRKLVLSR